MVKISNQFIKLKAVSTMVCDNGQSLIENYLSDVLIILSVSVTSV